jgi:hypothetical protein
MEQTYFAPRCKHKPSKNNNCAKRVHTDAVDKVTSLYTPFGFKVHGSKWLYLLPKETCGFTAPIFKEPKDY